MEMVSFAGALPKGEMNGLEEHSRDLAGALAAGRKHFVIGVMKTHSVKTGDDLVPVPTMAFTQVELIPFGDPHLEELAVDLLQAVRDQRRGGVGQQAFNLGGQGAAAEPVVAEPLGVEAGTEYALVITDTAPGRFSAALSSGPVEGVRARHGLMREEWGEIPPGTYQRHELDEGLQSLFDVLVVEWETNDGTSIIDAEIVDEDPAMGGDSE